jgi:hypothetical protein
MAPISLPVKQRWSSLTQLAKGKTTRLWQVEKTPLQKIPRMRGPEGRSSKHQPSPEGLGINLKMT